MVNAKRALRDGVVAGMYVLVVFLLTRWVAAPAFAMTFASSSVLLATLPRSEAARPRNLIGGHLLAALCGWTVGASLGDGALQAALAIGLAALVMQVTGTLHPPAAVSGYLMLNQHAHWTWMAAPILAGAIILALLSRAVEAISPTD